MCARINKLVGWIHPFVQIDEAGTCIYVRWIKLNYSWILWIKKAKITHTLWNHSSSNVVEHICHVSWIYTNINVCINVYICMLESVCVGAIKWRGEFCQAMNTCLQQYKPRKPSDSAPTHIAGDYPNIPIYVLLYVCAFTSGQCGMVDVNPSIDEWWRRRMIGLDALPYFQLTKWQLLQTAKCIRTVVPTTNEQTGSE